MTTIPPITGFNLLKRESIVRILQYLELATISKQDKNALNVAVVVWLMTHIPNRLLRIAAGIQTQEVPDGSKATTQETGNLALNRNRAHHRD